MLPSLLPVAAAAIFLVVVAVFAVLRSPLVLLLLLLIGFGVYAMVTYYMKQEAEEKRVKAQEKAEADKRRERERREEAESRSKESEARAEAKRRRIKETEAAISGYLTEGIRQDFVGKTQDDLLPPEDHPFDEVYSGMTEEERIRHVNYVSANTTLKGLKPTASMDPVQRERYTEAQAAFAALGYRVEEVEKALNDVPPQDSVEKYIKEALRRMGSRL